jgi:hemin uptake protein HemP
MTTSTTAEPTTIHEQASEIEMFVSAVVLIAALPSVASLGPDTTIVIIHTGVSWRLKIPDQFGHFLFGTMYQYDLEYTTLESRSS